MLIAYGCFQFEQILSPQARVVFWFLATVAVLLAAGWNTWVFFSDILPARVLVVRLIKTLEKLEIKKFYTYDTEYNDILINTMSPAMRKKYQIDFIESLEEVREGYVVIPGVSSKSWSVESCECGIKGQDFNKDPLLTKLIHTRKIKRFSVASFKTLGTSKIWVNESEITTYRNYIVKDITSLDRWCAHAWILDAGKLHDYLGEAGTL